MIALYDHIQELRAELRSCVMVEAQAQRFAFAPR
jgi:hypothetical protein